MAERRFSLTKTRFLREDHVMIRDKHTGEIYRSWVLSEMNRLVKLMNKMTGVSR